MARALVIALGIVLLLGAGNTPLEIHDNVDDEKVYAAKDGVTVTSGEETAVRLVRSE